MRRTQLGILAGGLTVALVCYGVVRGLASLQAEDVRGPAHWVAFSADVKVVTPSGEARGKFYRTTDGSTRMDAYGPGWTYPAITIHNATTRTTYYQAPDGTWSSMPLGQHDRNTPKMSLPARASRVPEYVNGVIAYRQESPRDEKIWTAPELNFMSVVTETPHRRKDLYNIRKATPEATLFGPPPGVSIRAATTVEDLYHR